MKKSRPSKITTAAFQAALERPHNAPIERKPTRPMQRKKPRSALARFIDERDAARRISRNKVVQQARDLDVAQRLSTRVSGPSAPALRKASDAAGIRGRRPSPPA